LPHKQTHQLSQCLKPSAGFQSRNNNLLTTKHVYNCKIQIENNGHWLPNI
jgi:hypothetical protein